MVAARSRSGLKARAGCDSLSLSEHSCRVQPTYNSGQISENSARSHCTPVLQQAFDASLTGHIVSREWQQAARQYGMVFRSALSTARDSSSRKKHTAGREGVAYNRCEGFNQGCAQLRRICPAVELQDHKSSIPVTREATIKLAMSPRGLCTG